MAWQELSERRAAQLGAAFAALAIGSVSIASLTHHDLLMMLIQTHIVVPLIGIALLGRAIVAVIAFFSSARPSATRSFRAFFWRDAWLRDALYIGQPRTALAIGACFVSIRLGAIALLAVSAFGVMFGAISVAQAISAFVVTTILGVVVQAIGSSYLIAAQIINWRVMKD